MTIKNPGLFSVGMDPVIITARFYAFYLLSLCLQSYFGWS